MDFFDSAYVVKVVKENVWLLFQVHKKCIASQSKTQ